MDTRRKRRPASPVQRGSFFIGAHLACLALAGGCAEVDPPPSVYDDAALAAQIAENDGVEGVLPRFQAWVGGHETFYWIIDGAVETAMPLYLLCRPGTGRECARVDHPPIVGALPGDPGYSPFGQEHHVRVPDGWDGQVASVEELNALIESEGLEPAVARSRLVHCPIAAPDAGIDLGDGVVVNPETPIYVRGMQARCFDFSDRPNRALLPDGTLFVRNVYLLTREDEMEPLSEPMRMSDLNGDGDQLDSNNIFGADVTDDDYTPLWRLVLVTVPAGLPSIDTTPAYTASTDMFDISPDYVITPRMDRVVDHEITTTLINCPLQSAPGRL